MIRASVNPSALRCRTSGFTLVELMVVVAVLAALLSIGGPSFMEWIQNSRIRTVAESLQNGLQVARAEAVRRNTNVEFILQANGGWLVQLQQGAVFVQRAVAEGGANVTVTSTPAGSTTLTYNGMGRVNTSNGDGSEPLTQVAVDLAESVLPAAKSRDLQLTVGVGGEVRMCDPNVADGDLLDPRRC